METILYRNNQRFEERQFSIEKDYEKLVIENSKTLFGQNSLIIDAKRKIATQFLGGTIPDCFLLYLNDPENPEFYVVEIELAKHNFFGHIFPQVTKFFAFFKNQNAQNQLIEKLYEIFDKDIELKKELKSKIGNREIYKFLKDMVENSQNILLILDDDKKELPEIINTYSDTWGKIVKVAILKNYVNGNENIISISPDFENLENVELIEENEENGKVLTGNYSEEYHLESVNQETKDNYFELKKSLINTIPNIAFNPQRYYISFRKKRNFAYLKIRKTKLVIVVMSSFETTKERVKDHQVKPLSEGIQKFYNGDCCQIVIDKSKKLNQLIDLLKEIQK
jgi:predicted transport protein